MASASEKKRSSAAAAAESNTSSLEQAGQLITVLVVAAVVAVLAQKASRWINDWYLPFCDSNTRSQENCIPCPEHGICQGGQLECLTGFKKSGRRCVENRLIEKNAEKLARSFKDHVCTINGRSACNGAGSVWLTEGEILDAVKDENLKLQGPNLWLVQEKAVAIASGRLDSKIHGGMRVFGCPLHLVNGYKPYGCRIREWCFQNFLKLLVILPLVSVLTSFLWKYWRHKLRKSRAEQLYSQVCEALEAKASGDLQSSLGNETWIIPSRLRDHLLRPGERKNRTVWLEVERLVQEDSRIEQYPKIVKGESRIVWEWQVEGSLSPLTKLQRRSGPYRRTAAVPSPSPRSDTGTVKEESPT